MKISEGGAVVEQRPETPHGFVGTDRGAISTTARAQAERDKIPAPPNRGFFTNLAGGLIGAMVGVAIVLSTLLWAGQGLAQSAYPSITASSLGASPVLNFTLGTVQNAPQNNPLVNQGQSTLFNLGVICTISNGASLTYSLQVTADPQPKTSGHWNNHDVIVSQTASINSNIAYPVTGAQINVTSYSSGSVTCGFARYP